MPSGAKRMTTRTIRVTPLDRSSTTVRVVSPAWRRATPRPMAQVSTPMKLALSSALTGLSTALSSRFCITSLMPPGALRVASPVLSTSCDGNSMLATTATTAAAKVPSRYSQRIGRMWVSWPWRWLAIDAMTRMNTSTGATAFRALTNTLPRKARSRATAGASRARAMPATRPMTICVTRLVRLRRRKRGVM
ncbi:hypothetical protein D3C76_719690 [compost metagenome]